MSFAHKTLSRSPDQHFQKTLVAKKTFQFWGPLVELCCLNNEQNKLPQPFQLKLGLGLSWRY